MNRISLLSACAALLLFSCKEVAPPIDFTQPVEGLVDTNFIAASVPPAQSKIVLLEDVTGVRCINCPQAAVKAKEILANKTEDSVIVMALYPSPPFLDNFTTPFPGVPKLATDMAREIVEGVDVTNSMPFGYIDRHLFTGSTKRTLDYNLWAGKVNERLRESAPVNIELSKTYDNATRELIVTMRLTYTADISSGNHKIALYLTESDIVSTQKNIYTGNDDPTYVHNHALRYAFTPAMGTALGASLVRGRVFVKQYKYTLPAEFVADNCHIVGLVSEVSGESVQNVRSIDIK